MDGLILKNFTASAREDELTYRSALCPTGYEDWFRALGLHLDGRNVRAVAVTELTDGFALSCLEPGESGAEEFGGQLMRNKEIQALLDAAYVRRGSETSSPDRLDR
jgi:hypothetical protein